MYLCEPLYTSLARTLVYQSILHRTSLLKEILLGVEATVVVSGVSGFVFTVVVGASVVLGGAANRAMYK